MNLLKHCSLCLTFMLLASEIQTVKFNDDYQKGIKARIYKIIEKSNQIYLKQDESVEFNKDGLLKYLDKNANLEYRVNNILSNREEEKNAGVKKRWIKRIVRHGQATPDFEFDKNFGLSFKPLVRLHKTKRIDLENEEKIPKMEKVQNDLMYLRTRFNFEALKERLKRDKYYTAEAEHVCHHMKYVDIIIGELGLPYLSRKLQKKLKSHHARISPEVELLYHDIMNVVSDERYLRKGLDEISNGNRNETDDGQSNLFMIAENLGFSIPPDTEMVSELPSPLFPKQPLWNFWTYKEQLHFHECPEGQVKIGNLCSHVPHHRKTLH